MEYHNPLEGRLKFVIDNLETAHAIYENLGYIQGYMDRAKVNSPKMISEDYLREMERENLLKAGLKGLEPRSEWELEREKERIRECVERIVDLPVEEENVEIIVSDEVKECIQKGNWQRYKESVYKYNCSCCSAEITGPIILILTLEKNPLCESCFERLKKQIKGDYMKEDDADRDYWKEREREKAESMEVKENEIDENA